MKKILIVFILLLAIFGVVNPSAAWAATVNNQTDFSLEGVIEIPSAVVHQESPLWPLSWLIDYFIQSGVASDILYLILTVPFIAFIIAFFRQVVGISTFGVYSPLLISLSFLLLGQIFGLAMLLLIILVSYALRKVISRANMLYIPRTSFLISCTALSFFIVIWFVINFGSPVAIGVAIFPMLMISTISERINSAQVEEGFSEAFKGIIQTIVISLLAYYFVIWPWLIKTVISFPEIILLPLAGTLLLGKFSGLRLIEYFRFRTLFKDTIEEE